MELSRMRRRVVFVSHLLPHNATIYNHCRRPLPTRYRSKIIIVKKAGTCPRRPKNTQNAMLDSADMSKEMFLTNLKLHNFHLVRKNRLTDWHIGSRRNLSRPIRRSKRDLFICHHLLMCAVPVIIIRTSREVKGFDDKRDERRTIEDPKDRHK